MVSTMKLKIGFLLLMFSGFTCAWTNHTLVTHELVHSMPQVSEADPVKVESLAAFLLANEQELSALLASEEAWMAENLWHYKPLPKSLAFKTTGNSDDIVLRFKQAIRINPNAKLALYMQNIPGVDQDPKMPPNFVSVFNDTGHLQSVNIVKLIQGEWVAPADVMTTASDEPDHGHDIGLFTDSGTKYGEVYGFGKQPFGNPNLEYGTQAPFHMGFYHESDIIYSLAGFLRETYPQMRIHQYKRLAEFAFSRGHDYWGYRFMGWGLHYIGDFSNPYHVTPVPGNSVFSTIGLGILGIIGFPEYQKDAVQLVSNRHTVLEDFQYSVMTQAYEENKTEHPTIKALTVRFPVEPYSNNSVIDVFTLRSFEKGKALDGLIDHSFPHEYVHDVNVEYSELNALETLQETVISFGGQANHDRLVENVSHLLGDYSVHGASYVTDILRSAQP